MKYNPNIIYASDTSNVQDLTTSELLEGIIVQSPISSSQANGVAQNASLGVSELWILGNQYKATTLYSYGMVCTIRYQTTPTSIIDRKFICIDTSNTPISNQPPIINASVVQVNAPERVLFNTIDIWFGGAINSDYWSECTQNVDDFTLENTNGYTSIKQAFRTQIGAFIQGFWTVGEQPWGWFPCFGHIYPRTSDVANHIVATAPASILALFTVTESTLQFPNLVDGGDTANEFGYYMRNATVVGQKRGDAIRGLVGEFSSVETAPTGMFYTKSQRTGAKLTGDPYPVINTGVNISRVVPTASENRPLTYTVIPYIYIGVDYEAPNP